jgi:hypothetical protein
MPVALVLVCLLPARSASAQAPPFFGRGATIFDPENGVVQSGVLNDVQATVSGDRKYVTMTMRATNAQLLALREFTFQVGNGAPQGFVGGAGGGAAAAGAGARGNAGGGGAGATAVAGRSATRSVTRPSVLDRPGMTLLGRAAAAPDRSKGRSGLTSMPVNVDPGGRVP